MAVKTYQDSKDKYLKEKVDTFVLRVPKGKKDEIMQYAAANGMSLNGYITSLVFANMGVEVETAKKAPAKNEKATEIKKSTKPKSVKKPEEKTKVPEIIEIPAEPMETKATEIAEQEPPQSEVKKKRNMPSFLL